MLEIKRLGYYWAPELYKFLVKHKEIALISQRDLFLVPPQGVAIAAVNGREISQLILARIKNVTVTTSAIIGEYGPHSVELFDQLCAICSSSDPIAHEHRMTITKDFDSFEATWFASRLGKMAVGHHLDRTAKLFCGVISYPEIT